MTGVSDFAYSYACPFARRKGSWVTLKILAEIFRGNCRGARAAFSDAPDANEPFG
jgi:hypothetical protein